MSEKDVPSDSELEKGKGGLEHVETKIVASERKVVLKCGKCGTEQDFPICEECGDPLNYEEDKLECDSCGKTEPVPTHCDEPMTPKIV
ncbi:MAG: hypothetical protein ACXAC8_15270 [Candidatus Hodarchaeales archaeon]|jgi:primosomal protein N'